jgi:hypothetical protein
MSNKTSSILLWILSFLLMATMVVYQRMTGPTYPVRVKVLIGNQEIKGRLLTSSDSRNDEVIILTVKDTAIKGYYEYRRFKSHDEWTRLPLTRKGDDLTASLPHLPPAGKIMYNITLTKNNNTYPLNDKPVILRYKGEVPLYILIPHIILMFLAMVFSTRTGLEAVAKKGNSFILSVWTTVFLLLGGLILGPLVQYFAFGAFWTGWPWGHDLTDNKTAVALLFWIIALIRLNKKPTTRGWVIAAALILLAVYLVPHSILGSEIDYTQTATP